MSLADLFRTPFPDVALTIDHGHVSGARMSWRGGRAVVAAHASEALPPGAVVPSLATANMPDVPLVAQAVGRVLEQLGTRPSRVALVVPDTVAKISHLRLENIPARASDLQELVRWQIRKSAPFPIEQAVLSVTPGAPSPGGGHELIVSLARAEVIQQYEQACLMAGAHAGLVDLATFGVINGILAGQDAPAGDWLVIHATDTYLTLAVVRDRALLFFRNRGEESEGTLADLIHQTAMYYEDRLQGSGFGRVLMVGAARLPGGASQVRKGLEERLGIGVESVDPRASAPLADRIGASPDVLDLLSPLVGLLLREQRAA